MGISVSACLRKIHHDINPRDLQNAVTKPDDTYMDPKCERYFYVKKLLDKWIVVVARGDKKIEIITAFYISDRKKKRYIGSKLISRKWKKVGPRLPVYTATL